MTLKQVTVFEDEQGKIWKTQAEYVAHQKQVELDRLKFEISNTLPSAASYSMNTFLNVASKEELEILLEVFKKIRSRQAIGLNDAVFGLSGIPFRNK